MPAIQTILQDQSVLNSVLYAGGAIVGMGLNWTVKWLRKDIECIFDMVRTKPAATTAAFISQFVVLFGVIGTGALDSVSKAVAIALGVGAGSAIDAWTNAGAAKVWTDAERAAKTKEV